MKTSWTPLALTLSCLVFGHMRGEEGEKDALSSSKEEIEETLLPSSSHQQMRKRQLQLFTETTPSDSNTGPTFSYTNSWPTYPPTTPCIGPDPPSCGCGKQADYRGTIHKTMSGITCQNWRDQYPHFHYDTPWPNENEDPNGLEENYCRNPYGWRDRAWCYTTDTNVEWEYCEVPYCPLLPTLSPSPSVSKMPSDAPSSSSLPSALPSASYAPTLSSLPSTLPSSSPTYTGGCMNLTISILLPAKTFTWLDLTLRVNTIASDGAEIEWEIPYQLNSNDARINSISKKNSLNKEESICLPTGTYKLRYEGSSAHGAHGLAMAFALPSWSTGWSVNRTLFTLSSSFSGGDDGDDDEEATTIIACGDLLHDAMHGAISFDLPASTSSLFNNTKCAGENAFAPMQCYQKAFNFTVESGGLFGVQNNEEINRNVWFDQECGILLSDACKDKSNVLGFENGAMDDFCAFFECAYPDPKGTFPSCECLYRKWDCNHGAGCGEGTDNAAALECCEASGDTCDCELKQQCNEGIGDTEKCGDYAQYCCQDDRFDDDGKECRCNYYSHACLGSLRNKDAIEDGSCMQSDKYCFDCGALPGVTTQCESACTYWEEVCLANAGPICDFAADRCCGSDSDPFCKCEFGDYVKSKTNYVIGYDNCNAALAQPVVNRGEEKQSLINIYQGHNGENWFNSEGWLTDTPHCDWYGITCDDSEGAIYAIDLSFNNLTGQFYYLEWSLEEFHKLNSVILTGNALSGELFWNLYRLRSLAHFDVAENNLSGEAQLLVSPSIQQLNISHNRFTSILPIRQFRRGFHTLVVADSSHNNINQNCSEVLRNVPPNIRELRFTSNSIYGQLPSPLPVLNDLRILNMNNNDLSGTIPPVFSSFPMIKLLNLANQTSKSSTGLIGRIPTRWSNLIDLKRLDLSYNQLTNNIPAELGSLPSLQILNVSDNMLGGDTLPDEFGKLAANLMVLDASNNQFSGLIPSPALSESSANFKSVIKLNGNTNISSPAPLSLCSFEFFDLKEDSRLCPRERAALKDIYESTKGNEWTDAENWLSEHTFGCTWKGVTCNENLTITGLNLTHNGLSGKLIGSIEELSSLETLDLSDNDIKGSIPEEIGLLRSLKMLRLSNNAFSLTIPSSLGNLTQLELLHLHGNRLSGVMPVVSTELFTETSAFITDCGLPSEFEAAMVCDACTMCCNSKSECHDTKPDRIQEVTRKGFGSYAQFAWVFFLLLLGYALLIITISYICDLRQERSTGRSLRRQSVIGRDNKYAINTIGGDSVYQYFLGKSVLGWLFAAAVVTIQIVALLIFVNAAMKDFTDDVSDFIYSWKCPRNSLECINDNDLDWLGWLVFAVLTAAHCLKDLINGMKLLILCGKRRHGRKSRLRFFVAGLCLTFVSLFTVYASTVYNNAIARSNTDVIVNSVIILFVMDMDEYFYDAISAASLFWSAEKSTTRRAHEGNSLDDKKDDDSIDVEIPQAVNQSLIKQNLSGRDELIETCMQELDKMRQSNMQLEESNKRLEESNMRLEERIRQLEKLVLAPHQPAHDSSYH